MMKKYIFITLALIISVSCYKDEGSYYNGDWTEIVSVENLTPEEFKDLYTVTLVEDEMLKINPQITFKKGINPDDYTYNWVMGGDTISRTSELNWSVIRSSSMHASYDGRFSLWLALESRLSGESWKLFLQNNNKTQIAFEISQSATPQIATFVYEKSDSSLEWGSIAGVSTTKPSDYSKLNVDMFERYNSTRKIKGTVVNAVSAGSSLIIYTNEAPDYGAMIQTSEKGIRPLGAYISTVAEQVYQGSPAGEVNGQNFYDENLQELLIGEDLYVAPTPSSPFQVIFPGDEPSLSDVSQTMGANPYLNSMHFSVLRKTNGELNYYTFNTAYALKNFPLLDEKGETLKADKIVGVLRQPTAISKKIKFFLVVRQATGYNLYTYYLEQFENGNADITYHSKKDVSTWAGGLNDDSQWMTNALEVPGNYMYIIQGANVYRTSYESQEEPIKVKSYNGEITYAAVVPNTTKMVGPVLEKYMVLFVYDADSASSTMHIINAQEATMPELSQPETPIPGKVVKYLPKY